MKSRLVVVAVLTAVIVGWALPAAAHAVLVSSSPAPGATVTSPASVSLTFDDPLLDIGARISVLDSQGVDHAAGAAYFPEPTTIRVDVLPLDPGAYTAEWRVVADDGHPIEGTLPVTVVAASPEPSPSGKGTKTPEPSPSDRGAVLSSQPSPTGPIAATPSGPAAAGSNGQVYVTIALTLAAIAILAVAVFFLLPKDAETGSRRPRRRR